jgi:hypothetical protein
MMDWPSSVLHSISEHLEYTPRLYSITGVVKKYQPKGNRDQSYYSACDSDAGSKEDAGPDKLPLVS